MTFMIIGAMLCVASLVSIGRNIVDSRALTIIAIVLVITGGVILDEARKNKPKKNKIKLGLDLHGVISANPKFFSEISHLVIEDGGEVHVLTGSHSKEVLNELQEYGIRYTKLFSIVDYHKSIGTPIRYDERHTPWIDEELWNRAKAEYAEREGLTFHIDDSRNYGKFFKTPYAQIIVNGYDHKKTPFAEATKAKKESEK